MLLGAFIPSFVLADRWYLDIGDIFVEAKDNTQTVSQDGGVTKEDHNPIITNNGKTENTVIIKAEGNATANVTLENVNIDVSSKYEAAITTSGEGNVNIELDGTNKVVSSDNHAGLEKNNNGNLTITDSNKDPGSLDATGGDYGAGIGGGYGGAGSSITIENGKVTANGGSCGAGIGGGFQGEGTDITVSGGEVKATGSIGGAGIGGGSYGYGSRITVEKGEVTAKGGDNDRDDGAGIGGGYMGYGSTINIENGTVTAKGGKSGGAGIGGGLEGAGTVITVSNDAQVKVQGGEKYDQNYGTGAGIGGGGKNQKGGAELPQDPEKLNYGTIRYYAPGADMQTDAPTVIYNPNGCHNWNSGTVTTPATCTTPGVKTFTCQTDSAHTKTEELPAPGHQFSNYTYDNNATCTQDGTKTAQCERCNKTDTRPAKGSKLTHQFSNYTYNGDATCTQDGTETAKCERCNETDPRTKAGSKLGHLFETYVYNNDATYEKDGTETAKCERCDATDTRTAKGSKLTGNTAETAAEARQDAYWVSGADGRSLSYQSQVKDGILTVTVQADTASLRGSTGSLRQLEAQGITGIRFVTNKAQSDFTLSDLLTSGTGSFTLTHDGEAVTFTLAEKDISGILK